MVVNDKNGHSKDVCVAEGVSGACYCLLRQARFNQPQRRPQFNQPPFQPPPAATVPVTPHPIQPALLLGALPPWHRLPAGDVPTGRLPHHPTNLLTDRLPTVLFPDHHRHPVLVLQHQPGVHFLVLQETGVQAQGEERTAVWVSWWWGGRL